MAKPSTRKAPDPLLVDPPDFSLVLGGPLFQLLRRVRFADDALGLTPRRVLLAVVITWFPLALLSVAQGEFLGAGGAPFAHDIGVHLRFLVAVPLLIVAEPIVHWRLRPLVAQFRLRKLIPPEQAPRLEAAIEQLARWRNSVAAELVLIVVVYVGGVLLAWPRYVSLDVGAWPMSGSTARELSLAGVWLVFVSLPIFQFLLLRWYFRLFLWARFLWKVARLDLQLYAIHPDKAGGLGFLGESLNAVVPLAAAHGVLVSGMMADRIFYAGAKLTDYQVAIIGILAFLLALFAGPLLVFAPRLARVRRAGLKEYGALGQTYVRDFYGKWIGATPPADEPLIGSGDIQSLADLGNSFGSAEQMRIVPLSRAALLQFVAAFLLPILPLVLTMISLEALIGKLVGVVL